MIKKFFIDNFKSLVKFNLCLNTQFSCLVGLNGAGKSTVLQAFDFLAQLPEGELTTWLANRQWQARDLKSKLLKSGLIKFCIETDTVIWQGKFELKSLRCNYESFTVNGTVILIVDKESYQLNGEKKQLDFEYQGSILSGLKYERLPDTLKQFKKQLLNLNSLALLAPHFLKQAWQTELSSPKVSTGSEPLAYFIQSLTDDKQQHLLTQLQRFYPNVSALKLQKNKNQQQVIITETQSLDTQAEHLNDGMLRLIAILAQSLTNSQFLLLDEIENGVNPELIENLVNTLLSLPQQILVTTHSPVLINYLTDEQAQQSVMLIYRNKQGYTQAIPLFSLASMQQKLAVMGAGEAYVDTDLPALIDALNSEDNSAY